METKEIVYCSLDIETSGFDPLNNEVLEVGFVFFTVEKKDLKITQEWTQVFKPAKPVPPQIFGLTGISQKELDAAPEFSEYKKFLQDKLGQAVIVGHNIGFDIKFLEGSGIKFFGKVIDTLDLVQFLLPTHHSYNLENLMHTFQISHKEAHRALADSKATLKLLEKLLQVYSGLPKEVKAQIKKLTEPYNFGWAELLEKDFLPLTFLDVVKTPKLVKLSRAKNQKKLKPNTYYNFKIGVDYISVLARENIASNLLLVLPKAQAVLELYRQGKVAGMVFLPEQLFSEKKFSALLKKKNLSPEEVKFALKILVWQKTNWQTETLLDLNLSFFGGQYKNLVSGPPQKSKAFAKGVLATDLAGFLHLAENNLCRNFSAVVCGLSEFEAAVSSNIGTKTSWGYINYLFKSFYNPELNTGRGELKVSVEQGLLAGDLFFGLVNALLQTDPPGFVNFKISDQAEYDERYQKIKTAAVSYLEKLNSVNLVLDSGEIGKFTRDLNSFFESQENRVKWIELSQHVCAFLSMPLKIDKLVGEIVKNFSAVSFADTLDKKILPKFFLERLGFSNAEIEQRIEPVSKADKAAFGQADLFSALNTVFGIKAQKINYTCRAEVAKPEDLLVISGDQKALPATVLFASAAQVREFYEQNYLQLKENAAVLAQSSSGGTNKIFRNFGIRKNSVLLATDKLVLKHLNSQNALEAVTQLRVKTLVLCRLPFEQFTHPYQEALSASVKNAFEDYALPRALYNFHALLKFFYTSELMDIYIIDAKLSKPYAKIFKDYWQSLPGAVYKS